MKLLPLLLATLLLTLGAASAQNGRATEFLKREIPWGQPISMELFGGPPIKVSMRSRQVSFVTVDIADYTRMVPVTVNDATIYGPSRVMMQPTRETRRVEKKNGVPVPGGRSDMYLLYIEPTTGVQVYFSDETGGQNRDVLMFGLQSGNETAPNAVANREPAPPLPAEPQSTPNTDERPAKADGYLSDKLLDWYLRLADKRDRLNVKDQEAVRLFNEEAARYQAEVRMERSRAKR